MNVAKQDTQVTEMSSGSKILARSARSSSQTSIIRNKKARANSVLSLSRDRISILVPNASSELVEEGHKSGILLGKHHDNYHHQKASQPIKVVGSSTRINNSREYDVRDLNSTTPNLLNLTFINKNERNNDTNLHTNSNTPIQEMLSQQMRNDSVQQLHEAVPPNEYAQYALKMARF